MYMIGLITATVPGDRLDQDHEHPVPAEYRGNDRNRTGSSHYLE